MFSKEIKIKDKKIEKIIKRLTIANIVKLNMTDNITESNSTNTITISMAGVRYGYNLEIVDKLSKSLEGFINKRNSYFTDKGELRLDFKPVDYSKEKGVHPYGYEFDFEYLDKIEKEKIEKENQKRS